MKTKYFESALLERKQRVAVACLMLLFLFSFDGTSAAMQLSDQKRITAVQVATITEGARVTIVSDSALSDYEAFRRGDRFYVRIPSAQFSLPVPHLRAEGFEDVRGESVGDSVIISFKLQPGATAHVGERSNGLDVVFSSARRNALNEAAAATGSSQDSAGILLEDPGAGYSRKGQRKRGLQNSLPPGKVPVDASKTATREIAANPPSPGVSLSSIVLSPLPSRTSATPAVSANSQAAVSSSATDEPLSQKSPGRNALQWISARRLAMFPSAVVLLGFLFYVTRVFPGWRRNVRPRSLGVPKVPPVIPPKYEPAVDLDPAGSDN